MPFNDIPVTMYGMTVGTMDIADTGELTINLADPKFTLEWLTLFEAGGANVVQVAPYFMTESSPGDNEPPTPPSPPTTE